MNKREAALARIKYSGYHRNSDWLRIYVENRISYEAAQKAYHAGRQARDKGIACNCPDCKIIPLTCCCCGEVTHGRQWYNRDTGYGLCAKCANWIPTRGRETPEDMKENYGIEGVHYFLKEVTA